MLKCKQLFLLCKYHKCKKFTVDVIWTTRVVENASEAFGCAIVTFVVNPVGRKEAGTLQHNTRQQKKY